MVATVWMEMVPTACEVWRLLAGDIRSAPLNAQKLLEVSVKQKLPVLTAVKCLEMSPGVLEPPRLITEACNEGVLDSEKSDNRRSRLQTVTSAKSLRPVHLFTYCEGSCLTKRLMRGSDLIR